MIKFKELDLNKTIEYWEFLGLFHDYWLEVNEEETANVIDWPMKDGSVIKTTKCEAMFEWMVDLGGKVQLALDNNQMIGFLVYHEIFGCIIVIRCMYTLREYYDKGIGKGLIESIPIKAKRVIFQTRKAKPPEQMLKNSKAYRSKVCETDLMITWEMPWEV